MILVLSVSALFGQGKGSRFTGTFSLYIENDAVAGTDHGYTSGLKFTWVSSRLISLSFGQNIYTPQDIDRSDLIEDDRPYAGISYIGIGFHSIGRLHMYTLELDIGIVGPSSQAEQAQRFFHGLIESKNPKGWQHQLKDEFTLGLMADYKWKLLNISPGQDMGFDWITRVGSSLSNVITSASLGMLVRIGWNMPKDFGTFLIEPGGDSNVVFDTIGRRKFGFYVFISAEGHAVFRNIFLDGNTFQDSHRVEKEPNTADFIIGAALTLGRIKISYAHVYRTKQHKTQKREQVYGSVNLSYSF